MNAQIIVNDRMCWADAMSVGTYSDASGGYHVALVVVGPGGTHVASARPFNTLVIGVEMVWLAVIGLLFKR